MSNIPRIRSVRDTAKMFEEMDPKTEITESTLRTMIAEGTIPALKTYLCRGGGKLVNSV